MCLLFSCVSNCFRYVGPLNYIFFMSLKSCCSQLHVVNDSVIVVFGLFSTG